MDRSAEQIQTIHVFFALISAPSVQLIQPKSPLLPVSSQAPVFLLIDAASCVISAED
jgi:hypothetical protein